MTLAAHDIDDRLEQLISLTKRLVDLMTTETLALKARTLDASSRDWSEKEQLAHTYRLEMTELSRKPDMIVKASPILRKNLLKPCAAFRKCLPSTIPR